MNDIYREWIAKNVEGDGYGLCATVTQKMAEDFPELTRVRGHYYDMVWGPREHWWMVTDEGEVVDPTASQFPTKGKGEYEVWDESKPEPTGMCPECGEYCFEGRTFCCDNCERSCLAYLNSGRL